MGKYNLFYKFIIQNSSDYTCVWSWAVPKCPLSSFTPTAILKTLSFAYNVQHFHCIGWIYFLWLYLTRSMGRDSAVGIATGYCLDGPEIEAWWGRDFPHPSRSDPEAHPAFNKMSTASFPGGKASGAWRWPPTPSSVEVKERVGLYLYCHSGSLWPVLGRALPNK